MTIKHRLFKILTAVSLVLCITVCILWVRSYSGSDYIQRWKIHFGNDWHSQYRSYQLQWTAGQVRFIIQDGSHHFGNSRKTPPKWTPESMRPH